MSLKPHPLTASLTTMLTAVEAVRDDQVSVAMSLGATPSERVQREQFLAAEIAANASTFDDALSPATDALASLNELLLAVHGDPDMETPDVIRPLSWLDEMIKDCKARGPAPNCADVDAFWTMVQEVEAMHAGATTALRKLSPPTVAATPSQSSN